MLIYFIGIKGTGMTALAEVLKSERHKIIGSDTDEKFFTDTILNKQNIKYFEKFDSSHITKDIDLVIKSAAYDESNPEVKEAIELGLEIKNYTEALGDLSKNYFSVAVAGTHGKTTQTAMLSIILEAIDIDPLCIVGSAVPEFGNKNARIQNNKNDLLVAETCEYRRHFLDFYPNSVLIPSLDFDHGDYFKDEEDYCQAFVEFINKIPRDGNLVYCIDSVSNTFKNHLKKISGLNIISYGFSKNADIQISKPIIEGLLQKSTIKNLDIEINLSIPGAHNILNACGALVMAMEIFKTKSHNTFPLEKALSALSKFSGTKRRFEKIGEYKNSILFDDYAHHPTEIESTLKATRGFYPDKKIIAVFQSHTFSRTKLLENEFAKSLNIADEIVLAPIYSSAREIENNYSSKDFADIVKSTNKNTLYFDSFEKIIAYLKETISKNDLVITMGAGDVWKVVENLI